MFEWRVAFGGVAQRVWHSKEMNFTTERVDFRTVLNGSCITIVCRLLTFHSDTTLLLCKRNWLVVIIIVVIMTIWVVSSWFAIWLIFYDVIGPPFRIKMLFRSSHRTGWQFCNCRDLTWDLSKPTMLLSLSHLGISAKTTLSCTVPSLHHITIWLWMAPGL